MFTIICVLHESQFTGITEEVERETEWGFERVTSIYGRGGLLIYPKPHWKRTDELTEIEPSLQKYDGETH